MPKSFATPAAFRTALEDRLKKTAEARGVPVNTLRLKFAIERLLARLFAKAERLTSVRRPTRALVRQLEQAGEDFDEAHQQDGVLELFAVAIFPLRLFRHMVFPPLCVSPRSDWSVG